MLDCTPFVRMRMRAIEVLRGGNRVREQNKGKWRDYMGLKRKSSKWMSTVKEPLKIVGKNLPPKNMQPTDFSFI